MKNSQNIMGTKPIGPLLLSMSLPVMISMLIQSLYNIVDSFWVAKLGTNALTAVSLAFPIQNIIMSIAVGMGIGISAQVSISLGKGDDKAAGSAASLGTALVLIHCIILFLTGFFITEPFLSMFTDNPLILSMASDYTRIIIFLSFGELIQMCMEKIFQGAGKMMTTMFLMASGCIINMILDPIMIFGLCGFPSMGIKGAAYATVTGQICGMILYLVVYHFTDIGLKIRPEYLHFDSELIKKIYSVSVPSSLMLALPSLLTGVLNAILIQFGELYVAILGLYFKLQTFVNMPANGIIQGMRPIIGYNYGAENHKRVKKTIYFSLLLVTLISLTGTIISVFFPEPVLRLFNAEPKLLQEGILALRFMGPGFLLSTVSVVVCGVLESLGKGPESLVISLLRQFVILIPLGWILSKLQGASGIWISFPISEFITLIFSVKILCRLFHQELAV